jgi:hypothetical protein
MIGLPRAARVENRAAAYVRPSPARAETAHVPLPQATYHPCLALHPVDGKKVKFSFERDIVFRNMRQAFLESLPYQELVQAIIAGKCAYVNLGGPNGADLVGPDGIHSPAGWDRSIVLNTGPFSAICAKGTGFARRAKDAYQNHSYGLKDEGVHLPFDINPRAQFIDHLLVGGNNYTDLVKNAKGAYELLGLATGLGKERGGILVPLAIILIKSFPVPLRDNQGNPVKDKNGDQIWDNMAGWDYFTNTHVFREKEKLLAVAKFVKEKTRSRAVKWASDRLVNSLNDEKKISKLVRWLVGRAFMKLYKPGIYVYAGDSFRIGNAYRQLVSNGFGFFENGLVEQGLVPEVEMEMTKQWAVIAEQSPLALIDQTVLKEYMDRVLNSIYKPFGGIDLPHSTGCDLGTEEGRGAYLREIRKLNPEKTEQIAKAFIKEIASQMGILHGVGGNGGGHENMHSFGKVRIALENPKDGKIIYAVLKLVKHGEKTYSFELYNDRDEKEPLDNGLDLRDYRIVAMESYKYGDYRRGAPGGGIFRPDNCGFGPRDVHSAETVPPIMGLIKRYPARINNLEIREVLYHFHSKIMQEADSNLIFAENLADKIDGKSRQVSGAIQQLNTLFGGGDEELGQLKSVFWQEYEKWYALAFNKYAPPAYLEIDGRQPIYIIKGSYRKGESEAALAQYLERSARASLAA